MDRRTFVQSLAVAVAGLGGCAGSGANGGSDGDDGGETPTDTALERPTVLDTEFEVLDAGPGGQTDEAAVTAGDGRVVVDGTVWGSDGCATAALADATYDPETDELTVAVVETERDDAGDVCTQAIVEVTYRAVVSFDPDGPLPGTVVVTHDHGEGPETVAREDTTE